jgi:hypothetical protein
MDSGFTPGIVRMLAPSIDKWLFDNYGPGAVTLSLAQVAQNLFTGVCRLGQDHLGRLFQLFIRKASKGVYDFRLGPEREEVIIRGEELDIMRVRGCVFSECKVNKPIETLWS